MTLLHCAAGSGAAHGRGTGRTLRQLLQTVAFVGPTQTTMASTSTAEIIKKANTSARRTPAACSLRTPTVRIIENPTLGLTLVQTAAVAQTPIVGIPPMTINVNTQDERGRTPLHMAARFGTVHALHQLLSFGADPSLVDRYGETPLHYAATCCASSKCKLLLAYMTQAALCAKTFRNETVLHYAAGRGEQPGILIQRPNVFAARAYRLNMINLFVQVESLSHRVSFENTPHILIDAELRSQKRGLLFKENQVDPSINDVRIHCLQFTGHTCATRNSSDFCYVCICIHLTGLVDPFCETVANEELARDPSLAIKYRVCDV
jgi:hypothetical protein